MNNEYTYLLNGDLARWCANCGKSIKLNNYCKYCAECVDKYTQRTNPHIKIE